MPTGFLRGVEGMSTIWKAGSRVVCLVVLASLPMAAQAGTPSHKELASSSPHDDPYMVCETGKRQSPINIDMPLQTDKQETLKFRYKPSKLHVVHDGHSAQAVHEADSKVLWQGRAYPLLQFHAHAPSEHLLEGLAYPMELHLVHKHAEGHVVVIGLLVKIGAKNEELARAGDWIEQRLGHRLPEKGEEISGALELDVSKILPKNTSHYYLYQGSLTTPPCTEGVQWIVLKEPIEVSDQQVRRFLRSYGHTARPAQPLHGREIKED